MSAPRLWVRRSPPSRPDRLPPTPGEPPSPELRFAARLPAVPACLGGMLRRAHLGGLARPVATGSPANSASAFASAPTPAATMRAAVESLMERLKLTVNVEKTRCCRVPEESFEFLGYRIGRNYRRDTGRAYIGSRPSQASVQSICRRISELTARQHRVLEPEVVVGRLNRLITGWANYFCLGQVSPAYAAVDRQATRRLRQWLSRTR